MYTSMTRALLLGALVIAASPTPASTQPQQTLAVLDFTDNSGTGDEGLGRVAADRLIQELKSSGRFIPIERTRLQVVLEEQGLQGTGMIDPDRLVEIGRIAGADYVVVGGIDEVSQRKKTVRLKWVSGERIEVKAALNVRAISVLTGEIAAIATGEATRSTNNVDAAGEGTDIAPESARDALTDAVESAARSLLDGWEAPPVTAPEMISVDVDGRVIIDHGENDGIEEGQRFGIARVVEVIRDRDGEVLDQLTERVGTIEVVRVLTRSSICRLVEGEAEMDDIVVLLEGSG